MGSRKHPSAFYVETLILILVFVFVLLVVSGVFSASATKSRDAAMLSSAVDIASNAAEAACASCSSDDLLTLLDENGNARAVQGGVEARYDTAGSPDPEGELVLFVGWEEAENFVTCPVTVTYRDKVVYEIKTGVSLGGNRP